MKTELEKEKDQGERAVMVSLIIYDKHAL